MKQFHIYGIGNALVDIDFEVSLDTIERLNIDKGVMTLIDEATHHKLLRELEGIKHLKACGGSAANSLFTAQQLGAKTFYSCKVGNDKTGDFFAREMIFHGIETNVKAEGREGVTGKCIVMVTPDADRTMNTFLGATFNFSKEDLSELALQNAEYLYIEGYLVASPTACEAAILARKLAQENNIKTAISLSDPNMVTYFKDGLCEIIGGQVDLLFCNEREALLFTGAETLDDAKQNLKNYAKTFAITLGGEGSVIFDGNEFFHVPAYEAPVIDTVGAGDVFAGTFLYGITHGFSYREAADLASFAAAKVVAKFGPRLNQAEIADVIAAIPQEQIYA
ncbi:MAG: adenosine kinase [Gammaproteobacteria bacterium]|nr:adenosine kinase [Gammaproteobacteria bacterium]